MENAAKLQQPLTVKALDIDKAKFENNPDKAKGLRYQQWLESLKTDLYIRESANIVGDIATSKNGVAHK